MTRALAGEAPDAFVEASNVMYHRTGGDAEIDFVGPRLGVPFECKYVDRPWKRSAQTMRAEEGRGVMVTRSVFELEGDDVEKPIWAVPAGMVAWLLGP